MSYKRAIIFIFLLTICLLCGCATAKDSEENTDESTTGVKQYCLSKNDSEEKYMEFPQTYSYEDGVVTFNTDVLTEKVSFATTKASKLDAVDYYDMAKKLMKSDDVYPIPERKDKYISDDEEAGSMTVFLDNSGCQFSTPDSNKLIYSFGDNTSVNLNINKYTNEKEFEFSSPDEALKEVENFLLSYGIDTTGFRVDTYYLDYETLKSEEKYLDMDTGELVYENRLEWSEEDNTYMFYFYQTYCGLEVYPAFGNSKPSIDKEHYNTYPSIKIAYNEKGIRGAYINLVHFGDCEHIELLSFAEITEKVSNHFNQIIDKYTYEITEAKMICYIDANGETRPVWLFAVNEKDENDCEYGTTMLFDAETGKQIIIN